MIVKGLKVTDNQIRYVFPRSLQPIKTFTNVQQLGNILRTHFKETNLPNFPYKHVSHNKGHVQCQFCPNSLIYQFEEETKTYCLKQFSIQHVHAKDQQKHEKYKKSQIKSYSDIGLANQEIKKLLSQYSERIDEGNMQETESEVFSTFQDMINSFKKKKYYYYFQPQQFSVGQPYPDILLVVTPSMKQMYLKYGRCIGFDFTFNMVRQIPLSEQGKKQQYLIGVIAGLNSFRRITIYGLVASTKQGPKAIQVIFKKFFQHTGKRPQSIVTDQAIGMLSGIKRLQQKGIFQGASYWDTFHVLKSYRFKTDELRRGIRHMVRQKCPFKFQKMYLQAVNIAGCEDQMDSLHKFMHESQKYCMSQISPIFVGLGVTDTQNQIAHNVIKSQLPYQQRYLNVVSKLVGFLDQRNLLTSVCVRQTCKIEDVIGIKEYQILRVALPMKVHSFFYTQFYRATSIQILLVQNNRTIFFVQDSQTVYRVNLLVYDPKKGNDQSKYKRVYECTCFFKNKTGIPCEHILKIAIVQKANILDQFDSYYVIEDPQVMEACTIMNDKSEQKFVRKRGRPAWRSIFYVEKKAMDQNPDKLAPIKGRNFPIKNESLKSQISGMNGSSNNLNKMPEYANGTRYVSNRNQMIKNYYSTDRDNF